MSLSMVEVVGINWEDLFIMENLPQIVFWVIIIAGVIIVLKEAINVIFTRVEIENEITKAISANRKAQEKLQEYAEQINELSTQVDNTIKSWEAEKEETYAYVDEITRLASSIAEVNSNMYIKIELLSDLISANDRNPATEDKLQRCIEIIKQDTYYNTQYLELMEQKKERFQHNHQSIIKNIKQDFGRGGLSR